MQRDAGSCSILRHAGITAAGAADAVNCALRDYRVAAGDAVANPCPIIEIRQVVLRGIRLADRVRDSFCRNAESARRIT